MFILIHRHMTFKARVLWGVDLQSRIGRIFACFCLWLNEACLQWAFLASKPQYWNLRLSTALSKLY